MSDSMTLSNQQFLRRCVVEHLAGEDEFEDSLENINKWVWFHNRHEMEERKMSWTYQHSLATTRKWLMDNKVISKDTINGVSWFKLTPKFQPDVDDEEELYNEYMSDVYGC